MHPWKNGFARWGCLVSAFFGVGTRGGRPGPPGTPPPQPPSPFTVVEATIADMRTAMEQKRVTSHELVQQYLIRIATYEDKLHAAITVNPHALEEPTSAIASARRERFAVRCTAFRSR